MITVIIRKGPKPLPELFVQKAFPLVTKKAIESDDEAIIQVDILLYTVMPQISVRALI